jgi:hypothetical protein
LCIYLLVQLAHPGVDEWIARLAALPRLEVGLVLAPLDGVRELLVVLGEQSRVVVQQVVALLAPGELVAVLPYLAGRRPGGLVAVGRVAVHLPYPDHPGREVR